MSIFVDTGGWYASVVPADPHHGAVVSFLVSTHPPLVTTDYVVDETLTLLRARGDGDKAIVLGRQFFDLNTANVHRLTPDELRAAWELFRDRPDRDWSFTDCTSKVVMDHRHIRRAVAFDRHFIEFGFELVP